MQTNVAFDEKQFNTNSSVFLAKQRTIFRAQCILAVASITKQKHMKALYCASPYFEDNNQNVNDYTKARKTKHNIHKLLLI